MSETWLDYHLPPELIAQTPSKERDHSRLMVLDRITGEIQHHEFYRLPQLLRAGDLLVLNNTKVIPARLWANKSSGSRIEVLLLQQLSPGVWEVMARPGKRLRPGDHIEFGNSVRAIVKTIQPDGCRVIEFESEYELWNNLELIGQMPLPPYIHYQQELESLYKERYQTVFALDGAAVAAPTAGLHFTDGLLDRLRGMGVNTATVNLEVGAGTFRTISAEHLDNHIMHRERFDLPAATVELIQRTREVGGRVVAVGTTVVRVLEHVAQLGPLTPMQGSTELFVRPGFSFQSVDALITNFHLPHSTLLLLVSAFAGTEKVRAAYELAVKEQYRFFSFGDAMLIV